MDHKFSMEGWPLDVKEIRVQNDGAITFCLRGGNSRVVAKLDQRTPQVNLLRQAATCAANALPAHTKAVHLEEAYAARDKANKRILELGGDCGV